MTEARMAPEKQQYRQETMAFNWYLAHSHSGCKDTSGLLYHG